MSDSEQFFLHLSRVFNKVSSFPEMDYESPVPSPVPSPTREPSPVPDTPEKESPKKQEVPVKPSQNGEKHRKRRRKLVPKTFMDEDGYMGKHCHILTVKI